MPTSHAAPSFLACVATLMALFVTGLQAQVVERIGQSESKSTPPTVQLEFVPRFDRTLEVRYSKQMHWTLTGQRFGKLRSEFVIHWRFSDKGRGLMHAVGSFESIKYRGAGTWGKASWKHDVWWSRKRGYRRGKGSEADRKWVAPDIADGIRVDLDRRGASASKLRSKTIAAPKGLLASSLLGFSAVLPGKRVATHDHWSWRGLHIDGEAGHLCEATMRLVRVLDGDKRAEITCEIRYPQLPEDAAGSSSLVYSIEDALPRISHYDLNWKGNRVNVRTSARWLDAKPQSKRG